MARQIERDEAVFAGELALSLAGENTATRRVAMDQHKRCSGPAGIIHNQVGMGCR
jgi:hypothetical protein